MKRNVDLYDEVNAAYDSHHFIRKWCNLIEIPAGSRRIFSVDPYIVTSQTRVKTAVIEDLSTGDMDTLLLVRGLAVNMSSMYFISSPCVLHKLATGDTWIVTFASLLPGIITLTLAVCSWT